MKAITAISLTLLVSFIGVKGEGCGIAEHDGVSPIIINAAETTGPSQILQRFQLVDVISTATVSSPFNGYLQAQRYHNGVYDIVTAADGSFSSVVANERVTEFNRTAVLYCTDETDAYVTFTINVPDLNNFAPEFNQESYTIDVQLPLIPIDEYTTISANIVVIDRDLEEGNADVYITSSNRHITPFTTKDENATSTHTFKVDLRVENTIEAGEYVALLTADDGNHFTSVTVTVNVLDGNPETEPTATTTTTTTIAPPTNATEPEQETTETDAPATNTTTRTTTTTEEPTTEGPAHKCGLVGLDPENTISLDEPLLPVLPVATEVWSHTMFNVASTSAISHPHNKYLSAYRQGTKYWFQTNNDYSNFLVEQAPATAIIRNVNFNCADGSVVRYTFSLPVYDGPMTEPTLKSIVL